MSGLGLVFLLSRSWDWRALCPASLSSKASSAGELASKHVCPSRGSWHITPWANSCHAIACMCYGDVMPSQRLAHFRAMPFRAPKKHLFLAVCSYFCPRFWRHSLHPGSCKLSSTLVRHPLVRCMCMYLMTSLGVVLIDFSRTSKLKRP
jgi:hypothetical protein